MAEFTLTNDVSFKIKFYFLKDMSRQHDNVYNAEKYNSTLNHIIEACTGFHK